ncbi:MAG: hypothetical protein JJE46_08015 [Acidimicrobiia bacterium]|nr:hypothetical protein [Acidimicrobiia bacterium]
MPTPTIRAWGYDGSALQVDTATGKVVGAWVPIPGEAELRLDFPTPAELCRGCGRVLLTSGSKFSIWFCATCEPQVTDLNAAAGRCVIPRGRHTLCNGIGTTPAHQWQTEDVHRFVHDFRGLWDSMQLLECWAAEIVRRNCVALGLDAPRAVALSTYLDRVRHDDGIADIDAFVRMLDWWAEQ